MTDKEVMQQALEQPVQEQQQAEPPPEWLLIKNILDEYGLQAIDFVAEFKAAQQVVGVTHCQCEACKNGNIHDSDCSVHNGDALPVGPCDCSLATPPLPVQEPVAWQFMNGSNFRKRRPYGFADLDSDGLPYWKPLDTTPPLPVQPMHKLRRGDILRCIETDELCTVWATSTTSKTLIKWSANNFGNYTAEQIGELFWIEPREAEHVMWDKPSDNFNAWWDSDRRRDNANPFQTDSFAYWAFEGWQAALAQRQWVGLTNEEIRDCLGPEAVRIPPGWSMLTQAIEAKLKEKNHG